MKCNKISIVTVRIYFKQNAVLHANMGPCPARCSFWRRCRRRQWSPEDNAGAHQPAGRLRPSWQHQSSDGYQQTGHTGPGPDETWASGQEDRVQPAWPGGERKWYRDMHIFLYHSVAIFTVQLFFFNKPHDLTPVHFVFKGRTHIFKIHARSMSVERDIRFELLARLCPNSTGKTDKPAFSPCSCHLSYEVSVSLCFPCPTSSLSSCVLK